jgi:DNA-binding NarL/FixJ family response regulator
LAAISQLRDVYGPLPVVALADFPTSDRVEAAKDMGVRAVLGKPNAVVDLIAELRNE